MLFTNFPSHVPLLSSLESRNYKEGLLVQLLIGNIWSLLLDALFVPAYNTLDSQYDRKSWLIWFHNQVLNALWKNELPFFDDTSSQDRLLWVLTTLYENGSLKTKQIDIYVSPCRRFIFPTNVNIYKLKIFKGLSSVEIDDELRKYDMKKTEVLVFYPQSEAEIRLYPERHKVELDNISQWLRNNWRIISRLHETGIIFRGFNIDIDFFWFGFLAALLHEHREDKSVITWNKRVFPHLSAIGHIVQEVGWHEMQILQVPYIQGYSIWTRQQWESHLDVINSLWYGWKKDEYQFSPSSRVLIDQDIDQLISLLWKTGEIGAIPSLVHKEALRNEVRWWKKQ